MNNPIAKTRALYLCACLSSLALLILLLVEHSPVHVLVLALVGFGFWIAAFNRADHSSAAPSLPLNVAELAAPDPGQMVERYYSALLGSLARNWQLLDMDLDQAQSTLRNVHHALLDAVDTAHSTGMLALNSMLNAAGTGEIGRGFVTVSRDLVSISAQSCEDLQRMNDVVARAEKRMHRVRALFDTRVPQWARSEYDRLITELEGTSVCACNAQEELRMIVERYQKNSKSDVRWLQLGEAVRRLLNEVINILYQYELRSYDVISDLRLVCLSGHLPAHQLLELQSGIRSNPSAEQGL